MYGVTCDYRSKAGVKLFWKRKCNISVEGTFGKLEYNVGSGTGRALMLKRE